MLGFNTIRHMAKTPWLNLQGVFLMFKVPRELKKVHPQGPNWALGVCFVSLATEIQFANDAWRNSTPKTRRI
jgi:hypothetical protein